MTQHVFYLQLHVRRTEGLMTVSIQLRLISLLLHLLTSYQDGDTAEGRMGRMRECDVAAT